MVAGVQAYRITLSPKEDVNEHCERKFIRWLDRSCAMVYCVAEHGESGKRHFHALALFDSRKEKHILHNYIWQNHVKPYHPDSIGKFAILLNTAYNFEWRDDYLRKEVDVEVLLDRWDDAHCEKYLPSLEDQAALVEARNIAQGGVLGAQRKHVEDLHDRFKVWFTREVNALTSVAMVHVLEFIQVEMVNHRMQYIYDTRRRREKAIGLYHMFTKDVKPTEGDKEYLNTYRDGRTQ